jgi:hypothetical protein
MWGKRLAPGIVVWIVAIIMNFHPVVMMIGTVFLLIGFAAVVYYMVAERWRRPYYVEFKEPPDVPDSLEGGTRPVNRSSARAHQN